MKPNQRFIEPKSIRGQKFNIHTQRGKLQMQQRKNLKSFNKTKHFDLYLESKKLQNEQK